MPDARRPPWWVLGALALAFGLRFFLAWRYVGNYDEQSYEIVQTILRQGGNVYLETMRYNYGPVWAWCLEGLGAIARLTGLAPHLVIRGFLTLADGAIAWLLFRLATPLGLPRWRTVLLFALNPVSILITGYHGQFDNLAVLGLLGALWMQLAPGPLTRARRFGAWVWAAAAVLVKQIALFAPIFVLGRAFPSPWQRFIAFGLAAVPFMLSFVPYGGQGTPAILHNVISYAPLGPAYGVTLMFQTLAPGQHAPSWALSALKAVLAACFIVGGLCAHRLLPQRAALLCWLIFLAATPRISDQYFVLPVAFGALAPSWPFALYSFVVGIYLLGAPTNLAWAPAAAWVGTGSVWACVLVWLGYELRQAWRAPVEA